MLIHFTKSIESLDSITRNGFLYLHNETGVLGPVVHKSFGIENADGQSNGMVCFTELSPGETIDHQLKYGQFGVGVSKEWLIKNGARKVTYVEIGSDIYKSLVKKLKSVAPKYLYGVPTEEYLANPETSFNGTQALTSADWAISAGTDDKYIELLGSLSWTQTDQHSAEGEWRVRNPKPFRTTGRATRKQQIELMLSSISNSSIPDKFDGLIKSTIDGRIGLACTGKLSLVLPLPKEEIRALFCPTTYEATIQSALIQSGLNHVPIFTVQQ